MGIVLAHVAVAHEGRNHVAAAVHIAGHDQRTHTDGDLCVGARGKADYGLTNRRLY